MQAPDWSKKQPVVSLSDLQQQLPSLSKEEQSKVRATLSKISALPRVFPVNP